MLKRSLFSVVFLAVFLLFGLALATPMPYSETVTFNGLSAEKLNGLGDYVAWEYDFSNLWSDPAAVTIGNANVSLSLKDDTRDLKWLPGELGLYKGEDGTKSIWEVDTGIYTFNVRSSSLLDGNFSAVLASLGGDFFIKAATLDFSWATNDASHDVSAAPVPEPATVLLMGTGLVGVLGASRKKFMKKRRS